MLSPWVLELLVSQNVQILTDSGSGLRWVDDIINESAIGSWERVTELLGVFLLGFDKILTSEDDLDGPLGAHDGDLSSGP